MSREQNLTLPPQALTVVGPSDDDLHLQINLRLHLDEVADIEAKGLRASARREATRRELCQLACKIYDARRARERVFDAQLFGEPAWDMLLALYCLPTRGELLTVTALSLASAVPETTGLRWQNILTSQGLIERGPHGVDARKQMVRLTVDGRRLLEKYLTRLFYCNTPIPPRPEAAGG